MNIVTLAILGNLLLIASVWVCWWAFHRWQRAVWRRERDEAAQGFPVQLSNAPPPRRFPCIVDPQVALLHAQTRTGIVLSLDGEPHIGTGDKYVVFSSRAEAEDYARGAVLRNTEIECAIFDPAGDCVTVVRPTWTQQT